MPELPEVEFAARKLRGWLSGKRIAKAEVDKTRIVRPHDPAQVLRALSGHTLATVDRRAKYLLFTFDKDQGALSHLGMTGKWVMRQPQDLVRFSRLRLFLEEGSVIHYADARMFGQFRVMPAQALWEQPAVKALGPDPLVDGLTSKDMQARFGRSSRPIKIVLMDQSVIGGLGNIHAAEALYRAKIHPARKANSLTSNEVSRLRKAILASIGYALGIDEKSATNEIQYVEEGGPNPFKVYGRKGETCPRCGQHISTFTQGGRTTYFCPGCQKA